MKKTNTLALAAFTKLSSYINNIISIKLSIKFFSSHNLPLPVFGFIKPSFINSSNSIYLTTTNLISNTKFRTLFTSHSDLISYSNLNPNQLPRVKAFQRVIQQYISCLENHYTRHELIQFGVHELKTSDDILKLITDQFKHKGLSYKIVLEDLNLMKLYGIYLMEQDSFNKNILTMEGFKKKISTEVSNMLVQVDYDLESPNDPILQSLNKDDFKLAQLLISEKTLISPQLDSSSPFNTGIQKRFVHSSLKIIQFDDFSHNDLNDLNDKSIETKLTQQKELKSLFSSSYQVRRYSAYS
jgi:hypothetical protein